VVRVVAPAGPLDPDRFRRGLEVLKSRLGLVPRARGDVLSADGYLAGGDGRRLEEWREAAGDPEARAIWCARGGYGAMRLLQRLDPGPLVSSPKWLVGFSDITALHALLNDAGLATVHGPLVVNLPDLTSAAMDHLEALLFGRAAPARGGAPPPGAGLLGTAVIRPGRARGPLRGGTLSLLAHLCGTRWQPRLRGAILFLEDVDEKPYRLDRYLTQLGLAGALEGVAGVAVGRIAGGDEPGQSPVETVRALVRDLGVPAVEGLPAGHGPENLALPLGPISTLVAPGPGEPGLPRLLFGEAGA
jgi:muramoyltetrapeptide carboxypeptidase